MISRSFFSGAVAAVALLIGGCATGLRPYTSRHLPGQGARLELMENEVQGSSLLREDTAPAGIYVAEFENDDYVFYRGSSIGERHNLRRWTAHGGIAVSKKSPGIAILYTKDRLGVNLGRRIHARFVIRN